LLAPERGLKAGVKARERTVTATAEQERRQRTESFIVGATRLGELYKRSRRWGFNLLREWWRDQQDGGPVRVFRRKNGAMYTTLTVLDMHMPRGRRDEVLERRLRHIDRDLDQVFTRLAELERRIGMRR
jgi:hypothetical protein